MKKILIMILTALMVLSFSACTNNNGGNGGNTPESEVKGTVAEFGRIKALVPEGWNKAELGMYQNEFNGVIIKGPADEFMQHSQVSFIYALPTEMMISSRGFYDDVRTYPEFDLGNFHWEAWSGSFNGLVYYVAESYSDKGTIFFTAQQSTPENEVLTLDDPEVRAILASITVEPTTELDWVTINGNEVTAKLPAVEGYRWSDSGTMYTGEVEAWSEMLDDNTIIVRIDSGTGGYSQSLLLMDEAMDYMMGTAEFSFRIVDGKVEAVYGGSITVYDEAKPFDDGGGSYDDSTDYEYFDSVYPGLWVDNNNNLTLFLQKSEELEHGYSVILTINDKQYSATGTVEEGGDLLYSGLTADAEEIDTFGWFHLDGNMLIWGHDDAIGKFANATIFTKVE